MKMMLSFLMMLLGVVGAQTLGPSPTPAMTKDVRQSLAAFRGKIVILNFWATWCSPCRIEIPGYIALQNKYRDQGIEIVGVSIDPIAPRGDPGGAPAVAPFMKETGINYHVWMVDNVKALEGYDVSQGIPTTYVLDREGRIVKKYIGARPIALFEGDIRQLLSPQPKSECGPWDSKALGGDDLLYMRMITCVGSEGVKRIPQHSLSPSGDRYVFVGEFWERWESTRPPLSGQTSDLWMVNIDGTGLQRLTTNGASYDPDWSPDGNEIVLVDKGSIKILDTRSREVRTLRETCSVPSDSDKDSDWVVYGQPKWSPSGKAIAVVARNQHSEGRESSARVEVTTTDGSQLCHFARGVEQHQWSKEGELLLAYGKFMFDWDSIISPHIAQPKPQSEKHKAEAGSEEAADRLRNSLLKRVSSYGVIRIGNYSIAPSGGWIVFVGELENTNHASPESDLWLANLDGAGLRRLTENHHSAEPEWSPSGKEIAFRNGDSISVIEVKGNVVRSLPGLQAYRAKENEDDHNTSIYLSPRWSPNGKAIAAQGGNGGTAWIVAVEARSGNEILRSSDEVYSFAWNHEGELIVGNGGKLVFDWDRTFWYGSPAWKATQTSYEADAPASDPLLNRLLERVSAKGVKKIREYFPSPSDKRLVVVGEFEDMWRFVGIQVGRPKTDLWLVGDDGSRLRRLTTDGMSYDPAWSPSGSEIAFADEGSIKIMNLRTGRVRGLSGLKGARPYTWECDYSESGKPRWSPNGKAMLATSGNGCGGGFAVANVRSGKMFFHAGEYEDVVWNDDSELLFGYEGEVKVVFDWPAITKASRPASGRLFLFKQNGEYGYVDNSGESKIKPQFSDAGQFSEGLAPVAVDGKWGYINQTGELTSTPRFDAALPFSRGLARVKVNGRWKLIKKRSLREIGQPARPAIPRSAPH